MDAENNAAEMILLTVSMGTQTSVYQSHEEFLCIDFRIDHQDYFLFMINDFSQIGYNTKLYAKVMPTFSYSTEFEAYEC